MRQTNYGLGRALGALGVQGGATPGLAPGGMVPTVQMANLGDSFAAQVFESRGIAGSHDQVVPVGDCDVMVLHSRSAGGCVIESIQTSTVREGTAISPSGWTLGSYGIGLDSTNFRAGGVGEYVTSLGGPSPVSTVFTTSFDLSLTPPIFAVLPPEWELQGIQIWVPPSSELTVFLAAEATSLTLADNPGFIGSITWREIPGIQGG